MKPSELTEQCVRQPAYGGSTPPRWTMTTERQCRIDGCERAPENRRTICSTHRHRIERYGDAFSFPQPRRLEIDFDALLAMETDDCVLWPGNRSKGYGYITRNNKTTGVHVLACASRHGDQPTPLHEVAHSCRNRHCMNYRHLRWSTRRENILDRLRDGTDNRGENHPLHKLTEASVCAIREQHASGISRSNLAKMYGVSYQTIWNCITGETWGWLA